MTRTLSTTTINDVNDGEARIGTRLHRPGLSQKGIN